MIKDRDITLVAKALIEMFGDDAPSRIDERKAEYEGAGSGEGSEFWGRVAEEVAQIERGLSLASKSAPSWQ